ncbi:MAG: bacterial transcriptional activator domain-containing protein [Caldilineaceae bacterium]
MAQWLLLNDCAEFEQWLLFKRESLHYRVINTLYAVAGYYEQRKLYEQAHQYAWRLVELEPALEEAHRQLMRLLASTGQRTAALAQFEKCRTLLQQEMDVEPADETLALFARSRTEFLLPLQTLQGYQPSKATNCLNNITPQPVPLVGRQQEIEQVSLLLQQTDYRLLTLIGPGGIGKRRYRCKLPMQCALFPHGIHFVPLHAVESSAAIPSAILEGIASPRQQYDRQH